MNSSKKAMYSKTSSCSARPKRRTLASNRASTAAQPLARLPQHPPQASGTFTRAVAPLLPLSVAWRGPESNQSPAADPWMWTVVDRSHRSWHRSAWPNLRRDPGSSLALLQHPMLNRKCHYALVTLFRGTIMVSLGVGRAAGIRPGMTHPARFSTCADRMPPLPPVSNSQPHATEDL